MANEKINTPKQAQNIARNDANQNKGPKSDSSFNNDVSRKAYQTEYNKNKK
jgi:hypothetical protein